ncbi:S41 family peptidase [Deinococcus sp. Marseille-Q6407]|uniref:S41 family peptidase n=1 Tax=Deinococcus sp. Marseille-Q6407 TaxID=2969223 RepID=UPI0021BE10A0|nr:S41 family peptidase [Deinococcus sp. Marseille-Q6407]
MNRKQVLLLTGALAGTAAVAYAQMPGYTSADLLRSPTGRSFTRVLNLLNTEYLYDVDNEAVLRGAIQGALGALNDEFTYYEEPAENEIDAANLEGQFYGIGVLLEGDRSGKGVRVGTVYQGGAAFGAGVQMGDVFLEVDGKDVRNSTTNELVKLVRGKQGSPVTVTFARNGNPFTVTMKRKEVPNVSVETAVLDGGVGYIALTSFYNKRVSEQFRAAVQQMKARGVTQLILDLRDNGGGLLNAGVDVADQFMQKGPIVSLRQKDGVNRLYGEATDSAGDYRGKLIVLVNHNSASASEVVSGALQDVKRATVIGEKTFGKGVAQLPFDTPDGGRVAIVNSEWVTPGGRRINKEGILPDILVKDTRFPIPLNFAGSGVKPGTELTLVVDGQEVKAKADSDGVFKYIGEFPHRERSSVQGQATVDLQGDRQLRAALEYFRSGKVSQDLQMTPEEAKKEREAAKKKNAETPDLPQSASSQSTQPAASGQSTQPAPAHP